MRAGGFPSSAGWCAPRRCHQVAGNRPCAKRARGSMASMRTARAESPAALRSVPEAAPGHQQQSTQSPRALWRIAPATFRQSHSD
eukprot:1932296-Alexandrium_andersonii.AAC.1